jgi:hypothetical protein
VAGKEELIDEVLKAVYEGNYRVEKRAGIKPSQIHVYPHERPEIKVEMSAYGDGITIWKEEWSIISRDKKRQLRNILKQREIERWDNDSDDVG